MTMETRAHTPANDYHYFTLGCQQDSDHKKMRIRNWGS